MGKKKRRKKRKPPAAKKASVRVPSGTAFNLWINFVLQAVTGRMAQGDAMMARHGDAIRSVARWLMDVRPVKVGVLYRGILVEPERLDRHWLEHEEQRKFLSWTQDRQVACWFADPKSIVSELVLQMYPGSRGYIASGKIEKKKVLWHHDWVEIPLPGLGVLNLAGAAAVHPEIDQGQFVWNLRTQREVISDAPERKESKMHVSPVEEGDCPDTEELDSRYAYPPYVAMRLLEHGG